MFFFLYIVISVWFYDFALLQQTASAWLIQINPVHLTLLPFIWFFCHWTWTLVFSRKKQKKVFWSMCGKLWFFQGKTKNQKTKVFGSLLGKLWFFGFSRKKQKTNISRHGPKKLWFFGFWFFLGKNKKTNISRHGPKNFVFWFFLGKNKKQTFPNMDQKTLFFFGFFLLYLYIPYIQECLPLFFGLSRVACL